jgi:hypothetical protein
MAIGTTAALLLGGAAVGSAALSSSASRSAGSTVAGATDRAADLQNQQFQQLLALQMPGYRRGEQASGAYMQALGLGGGQPQTQTTFQDPSAISAQSGLSGGYGGGSYTGQGGLMTGGGIQQQMIGDGADLAYSPLMMTGGGQGPQVSPLASPGDAQTLPPRPGDPMQTGVASGGGALDIYSQVRNTPGYQAQLDQGLKAIDRAAPLTGGMYSGRRMKALNDYGQNTFGSYYNDWMNRVGGVAGQGAQTAQNVGAAGMQNAQNVGNLMMTGANARAQGQTNSANAWTGAIGTGIGLYGGSQGWFGR